MDFANNGVSPDVVEQWFGAGAPQFGKFRGPEGAGSKRLRKKGVPIFVLRPDRVEIPHVQHENNSAAESNDETSASKRKANLAGPQADSDVTEDELSQSPHLAAVAAVVAKKQKTSIPTVPLPRPVQSATSNPTLTVSSISAKPRHVKDEDDKPLSVQMKQLKREEKSKKALAEVSNNSTRKADQISSAMPSAVWSDKMGATSSAASKPVKTVPTASNSTPVPQNPLSIQTKKSSKKSTSVESQFTQPTQLIQEFSQTQSSSVATDAQSPVKRALLPKDKLSAQSPAAPTLGLSIAPVPKFNTTSTPSTMSSSSAAAAAAAKPSSSAKKQDGAAASPGAQHVQQVVKTPAAELKVKPAAKSAVQEIASSSSTQEEKAGEDHKHRVYCVQRSEDRKSKLQKILAKIEKSDAKEGQRQRPTVVIFVKDATTGHDLAGDKDIAGVEIVSVQTSKGFSAVGNKRRYRRAAVLSNMPEVAEVASNVKKGQVIKVFTTDAFITSLRLLSNDIGAVVHYDMPRAPSGSPTDALQIYCDRETIVRHPSTKHKSYAIFHGTPNNRALANVLRTHFINGGNVKAAEDLAPIADGTAA